ncbi:hypothetical protein TWF694_005083 [Orbilia ellipsospora]|uniref:Mid2 domain-containing protein n=1 Tax=Orbilia ellipsospora TaxID=2528407 RepID=A0AAV9WVX0_9PEZI
MDAFTNVTDTLAFYDATGVHLIKARVGGGQDLCMCFALQQPASVSQPLSGALCLWFNAVGQVDNWWTFAYDRILAGTYRPYVEKALPVCGAGFDLNSAKENWSKTAVQPGFTDVESTVGVIDTQVVTATVVSYSVSTYVPSVVAYTDITSFTTTGADGALSTVASTRTTQLPVVTVYQSNPDEQGLSKADKIALGVGLGIGLPTIVLMVVGLVIPCILAKRRKRHHAEQWGTTGLSETGSSEYDRGASKLAKSIIKSDLDEISVVH